MNCFLKSLKITGISNNFLFCLTYTVSLASKNKQRIEGQFIITIDNNLWLEPTK